MEGAVVKEGFLYLQQQQAFGKKWKRFWGVLHAESPTASAQLELLEGSRPASAEKAKKAERSRRHLISLVDCVHVAEACGEVGCPKEATPFLLETTEKCYLLAAQAGEVADWILDLCKHAFVKDGIDRQGTLGKGLLKGQPSSFAMAENPLYSSTCKGDKATFLVAVRATPASERIRLWGRFLLAAGSEALELCDVREGTPVYTWPYRFLRRFGHDKVIFSFEAGRRCVSGEGSFEFATQQGREIICALEEAIRGQRGCGRPGPHPACSLKPPSRAATIPAGSSTSQAGSDKRIQADGGPALDQEPSFPAPLPQAPSLEPPWKAEPARACLAKPPSAALPEPHPKCVSQPEPRRKEGSRKVFAPLAPGAPESEYSEPFDATSRSFGGSVGRGSCRLPSWEQPPSPSASCGETHRAGPAAPASAGQDHVYDDPEGLVPVIYDEPQEYSGEAWKLQATAEDPGGYEYPYNPSLDDYSVPRMVATPGAALARLKWPWRN